MPTINQLNTADQVSGSDLLPMYSQANGDSRKISFTNFLAWLNGETIVTQDNKITQYSAPLTGTTVQVDVNSTGSSVWMILTPAGTIAALTLKMPLNTTVADRTELLVNSTQIVTTLTLDANGGTIVGGPATLAANGTFRLRFDIVLQTWYLVA